MQRASRCFRCFGPFARRHKRERRCNEGPQSDPASRSPLVVEAWFARGARAKQLVGRQHHAHPTPSHRVLVVPLPMCGGANQTLSTIQLQNSFRLFAVAPLAPPRKGVASLRDATPRSQADPSPPLCTPKPKNPKLRLKNIDGSQPLTCRFSLV